MSGLLPGSDAVSAKGDIAILMSEVRSEAAVN